VTPEYGGYSSRGCRKLPCEGHPRALGLSLPVAYGTEMGYFFTRRHAVHVCRRPLNRGGHVAHKYLATVGRDDRHLCRIDVTARAGNQEVLDLKHIDAGYTQRIRRR